MATQTDLFAIIADSAQSWLDAYKGLALVQDNPAEDAQDYNETNIQAYYTIDELRAQQSNARAVLDVVEINEVNYQAIMDAEFPTIKAFFTFTDPVGFTTYIKFDPIPPETTGYQIQYDSGTDSIVVSTF